jgi:DNA-binding NarL/FixJ family response regulator
MEIAFSFISKEELSEREIQILRLLTQGKLDKEIAEELHSAA